METEQNAEARRAQVEEESASKAEEAHAGSEGGGNARTEGDELAREISRLGEAIGDAARALWKSDQRHQLESDLRGCLQTLVDNLDETMSRFGRSKQGQEFQEKAAQAANRFRESFPAAELQDELARGLNRAANEVQKFTDSLEKQREEQPTEGMGGTQDIPVTEEGREGS